MQAIVMGIIRAVLAGAGGGAVAKGYIDTAMLEQIIGAVIVLATIAWSVYDKVKK